MSLAIFTIKLLIAWALSPSGAILAVVGALAFVADWIGEGGLRNL